MPATSAAAQQPVKSAGLCFTHYMSRITEGKGCSVDGCTRRARSRRLCKRHYEEALAAGNVCIISGCRRAPLGGEGMCYMHRRRYRVEGDAGEAAPVGHLTAPAPSTPTATAPSTSPSEDAAWASISW